MKMAVFWVVAPCSLLLTIVSEVLPPSIIRAMITETSINIYQTTGSNIPQDSQLQKYAP
jgi:hypothetical protein